MRELANHLERMAQINRDIREAAATAIAYCDRLLALRADFNFECNELLNNLTALMAEHDRTSPISRMQNEIVSLHQMLAEFQRRWPIAEIKLDPEGYLAGSGQVHAYVLRYIESSLRSIALDAAPVQQIQAIAPDNTVALLPTN